MVSQPGAGVALGLWFEPQSPERNEATVINRALGRMGRWRRGREGGREQATSRTTQDPLVASDSLLIDSLQTSQPRQAMAQTPREGRPARHAEAIIGWPSDVWRLARPAATGDLSHECIVAGRCLTAEGPSGNFTVVAEPKRCSDQSHVAMARRESVV